MSHLVESGLASTEALLSIFDQKIKTHPSIGIDRQSVLLYSKKIAGNIEFIRQQLLNSNYRFSPYLEKLAIKSRERKPRVLSVPTIRDKILLNVLKEYLHQKFPESVNRELINLKVTRIYESMKYRHLYCLKADISSFYDNVNQSKLVDILRLNGVVPEVVDLVVKAIQNPTVPKTYRKKDRDDYSSYVGVPQGLPISNLLANLYLAEVDSQMRSSDFEYHRYVDDILIVGTEESTKDARQKLEQQLRKQNLELNGEKTALIRPKEKFSFLGYQLSTESIEVKPESVQRHIDSVFAKLAWYKSMLSGSVSRPGYVTEEQLLHRLESDINEKITGAISGNKKYGWIFYFSSIDNSVVLHRLNKIIRTGAERIFGIDVLSKIRLKSYVRSFYEISKQPKGGYIHNYDLVDSYAKIQEYLNFRGFLDPKVTYKDEELLFIFESLRNKHLSEMQHDLGSVS